MKQIISFIFSVILTFSLKAQILPGFKPTGTFSEQHKVIEDSPSGTRILINAPLEGFNKDKSILLIFYALPNGNTIEYTFGKRVFDNDDWHFDIQHIAAQTRFLREIIPDQQIVVAYLETIQKSWPAWVSSTPGSITIVKNIVDDVSDIFSQWDTKIVLNGHSGGGRFILSYIASVTEIPPKVVRIGFLDSSYGYEDSIHGPKLSRWLKSGSDNFLCTMAYNDSVVIYNGKPLVSPTGGTWYRSKMMMQYLSSLFRFRKIETDSIQWFTAENRRIEFILKKNPDKKIFHTEQVGKNGFIQSIVSGTRNENKGYDYFGVRAYSSYLSDSILLPIRQLNIPPRNKFSESGSSFIKRISQLPLDEREEEIYKTLASGNLPGFLRNMVTINGEYTDSEGRIHKVTYEVMPDYLSAGDDTDFCRIPMNPYTAQTLATEFGASLITSAISDHIYRSAEIRLKPFNYIPSGNANELVTKFEEHNSQIEKQMIEAGGTNGQLVTGIKKDVIISNQLFSKPGKVIIYGWHKLDGNPIQPVYSGHIYWYVDYSHGIRLMNNQVLIDGRPHLLTDVLKDPMLYKIFSNEDSPMKQSIYIRQNR